MQQPVQRKPKKKFIDVVNDPKYANIGKPAANIAAVVVPIKPPRPNQEIHNPSTDSLDWGYFPEIKLATKTFEAGPIRLRYGVHKGPNNGFGLEHIWEAHFKSDDLNTPILALPVISEFLGEILKAGSGIYYEWGLGRAGNRSMVFKSNKGVAIVEERQDGQGNTIYVIVTAFPGNKAYGTLIGRTVDKQND